MRRFFLEFRNRLTEIYDEVFGAGSGGHTAKHGFAQKWKWFSSIYGLAQGDIRRVDEVTALPLHQCLVWMAYESDYNELQRKLMKQ